MPNIGLHFECPLLLLFEKKDLITLRRIKVLLIAILYVISLDIGKGVLYAPGLL